MTTTALVPKFRPQKAVRPVPTSEESNGRVSEAETPYVPRGEQPLFVTTNHDYPLGIRDDLLGAVMRGEKLAYAQLDVAGLRAAGARFYSPQQPLVRLEALAVLRALRERQR